MENRNCKLMILMLLENTKTLVKITTILTVLS